MRRLYPICCLVALVSLLCAPSLKAQAPASRIVASVDDSARVTLNGSMSALNRSEFDRGAASPSAVIPFMRLVLTRSQAQEAALEKFMAEQLDPSSPNYLHWLTPDQFAHLYGPSDSDIAAITGWLQSRGFTAVQVSSGRTSIAFTGSVSQIESAFGTSIHTFQHDGQQYFGNVTEPQIPSALAPVVMGVTGLTTFQPRSHLARGPSGQYDPQLQQFVEQAPENLRPSPEFTVGTAPNQFLYMVPSDAATIYDTPNSYNGNWSSSVSYNGTGVTIGIAGDAAITPQVVVNYRQRFLNGDTTAPTVSNNGAVLGGDSDEAYLDTEIAGGMAPGATIHFYTAGSSQGGLQTAIENAIADPKIDILSVSFGLCEDFLSNTQNTTINGWWQQASAAGIAVTVSTGDSGSAGCDNPNNVTTASYGLAVNGFSSTPYNIAVGGTDFFGLINPSGPGFSTYVNGNASSSNSYRSAKGYIPETPWNDTTTNIGPLASNVTYLNRQGSSSITSGTGGASTCSNNSTTFNAQQQPTIKCNSGYAKPSWQRGPGVPNDSHRDVPDVSLMAGNGFYGATWLVCSDRFQPQGQPTLYNDCSSQSSSSYGFYFEGYGGTSAAAPAFAGILALVQQKVGHRLGNSVPQTLYDMFNNNNAGASASFHDITLGNNSVPCLPGTPNCQNYSPNNNFLTGYDTTVGYDLATGIGSVDANLLLQAWTGGSGFGSGIATVTVSPASASITTQQSDQITITVAGSASIGTPTGSVTLSGGGLNTPAIALNSSGVGTFTIPAGDLSAGSVTLTANYTGDNNYAPASGTVVVTVTETRLTPGITVSTPTATVTSDQIVPVTVQVTGPVNKPTPTGNVNLTAGNYNSPQVPLGSTGSATFNIPANSFNNFGTVSVSAQYGGDGNYIKGADTISLVINPPYSMSGPSSSVTVSQGSNTTAQVTLKSDGVYTGSVTLTCMLMNGPTGANDSPGCSVTAGSPVSFSPTATTGSATITMTTTPAKSASLQRNGLPGWLGAGGGTALALLVFLGIPARRCGWRNMLGLLILVAALGSLAACSGGGGGNGGGGGGGGQADPGTTKGTYTFSVTGTGSPAINPAPTATVTLVVQ